MSIRDLLRWLFYVRRIARRDYHNCEACGGPREVRTVYSLFGDFDFWKCPDCECPEERTELERLLAPRRPLSPHTR